MLVSSESHANCKEDNVADLKKDKPEISSTERTLEDTERNHINKILSETRWRIEGKDGAATILGLHPSTLRAKMHKLGIERPQITEPD
jgi:formate hydrogenlyase transcriptional activator